MADLKLIMVSRCEEPFLSHLAVVPKDSEAYNGFTFLCLCGDGVCQKGECEFDYMYDIDWTKCRKWLNDPTVPICLDCLDRCEASCPELMHAEISRDNGYKGYAQHHCAGHHGTDKDI